MELTINTVIHIFEKYVKTKKQIILTRIATCLTYYLFGLFLVTYVREIAYFIHISFIVKKFNKTLYKRAGFIF